MLIIVLSNQIRFDQQKYGQESIVAESKMTYFDLTSWNSRRTFKISKTELSLQDLPVNLDQITQLVNSTVFKLTDATVVFKPL